MQDRVLSRNAQFQEWQALLTNRTKRQRLGEFLIHGVRPISLAVEYGWPLRRLLYPLGQKLSSWAEDLLSESGVQSVGVEPELLRELGERESGAPELIAVGALRSDDLGRLNAGEDFLGVAFDRPTNPGNIGTLLRSADAFGASCLIVTGHAADVYDPKSVRASTGSLFRLPAVRTSSPTEVLDWVTAQRERGLPIKIVGTDERGDVLVTECDLTGPVLLVVGNETTGMSSRWRELCDEIVRIPIGGAASSLNAASAGTLMLYEVARQRGFPT
ncbi:TrmH family RNA methyltransferase [Nonomuraea sp. WAC 01424]|uniref:TrmH family RNA methyltransferase n=1 Tax=Nonomuraea sp. WAC 01424 TaxID=2203200 RepID=UPI0021ADF105|nr:TrmH family RNA methyltransferase [Nonomuraea sp. WAC 01424]